MKLAGRRGPWLCRRGATLLSLTANELEGRKTRGDLHLDIDGARLDALERHCRDPLDHGCPCSEES